MLVRTRSMIRLLSTFTKTNTNKSPKAAVPSEEGIKDFSPLSPLFCLFLTLPSSYKVMQNYLEMRHRTVNDVIKSQPTKLLNTIYEDQTVLEAVKQMVSLNVGVTMVINKDTGMIAGIFTERDYLRKLVVLDKQSRNVLIKDVMTPGKDLVCVNSEYSVYQCMNLMSQKKVRHLPVVNSKGELQGVLGMKDLIRLFSSFHEAQIKYLQSFVNFPIW